LGNCTVPPRITPFTFGTAPLESGSVAQVQCLVDTGDPPLSITWHFHGKNVSSQMGITTGRFGQRSSILSIDHVIAGHAGVYTCVARNSFGEASFAAALNVNGTTAFNITTIRTFKFYLFLREMQKRLPMNAYHRTKDVVKVRRRIF
jgi:hypothetical protein